MLIEHWSDRIWLLSLADEPALSEDLAAALAEVAQLKQPPHLALDFTSVRFISSSNLSQLLKLRRLLMAHSSHMKLAGVSQPVRHVFDATGLDKVFEFAPDVLTALAGLQMSDQGA